MKRFLRISPLTVVLAAVLIAGIAIAAVTKGIRASGGIVYSDSDKSVYVTGYGAKGDGSTDDSAAIAAAITALGSTPNATLVFPSGQYLTTGISVSSVTGLRMRGEGAVLLSSTQASPVLTLTSCTHCEVSGFTVQHSSVGGGRTTNGDGILVLNSTDVKVHDNYIGPVTSIGIRIHGTSNQISVTNNYVTGTLADGIGTYSGATEVSVIGNHVKDSGDDAISVVGYNSSGTVNQHVSITGNTILFSGANNAHGVTITGANYVSVVGNVIDGTHYSGIAVLSTTAFGVLGTSHVQIAGNTISNVAIESGIYVWSDSATYIITDVNITGNTVYNSANAFVRAWAAVANAVYRVTVVGNHGYTNTGDNGISFLQVNEGLVEGNDIYYAWKSGIEINNQNNNVNTGWNNIYFPNQSNTATTYYATHNAATNGIAAPDFVMSDPGKASLLTTQTIQLGNADTLQVGAGGSGTKIVAASFDAATTVAVCGSSATTCNLGRSGVSTNVLGTAVIQGGVRIAKRNIADAAATVASTDHIIAWTSLSATRVITISCTTFGSATVPQEFIFKDESGSASGSVKLTLTPSAGTIDGSASKDIITSAYGAYRIYSNGANCFSW